ncbi:serine protein kinase [Alkalibacillus flavidus]|uniref:Serine protein kinase n=1 Tax=Alkalibacillus flavidus TaxID=546021 RepID=A0ABV2KVG5_9BACI
MQTGTLEDYVKHIQNGDIKPLTAHERLYQAFLWGESRGAFDHLVGMNHVLKQFHNYFLLPAAKGYDASKRLWLFVGPPGSGKSSLVQALKDVLIAFSKTGQGALYRFKDCPMQENPLWALPENVRHELQQSTGIHIEGSLSPYNQWRLEHDYHGDWRALPVERFTLSEQKRRGIGSFLPGDRYTQDLSDLIGDIDYAAVTTFGSSSDPRAYRYDGDIQASNQGLLELHEVLKCRDDLLFPFLTLAEQSMYKVSRQAMIHSDQVLMGHTNETEWKSFAANSANQSIVKRMMVLHVPYNMDVNEEVTHYQSYVQADIDKISPRTLETLAQAVIISRRAEDDDRQLYQEVEQLKQGVVSEHHERDGMDGIDTRSVYRALERSVSTLDRVTAFDVSKELVHVVDQDMTLTVKQQEWYRHIIHVVLDVFAADLMQLIEERVMDSESVQMKAFITDVMASAEQLHEQFGFSTKVYDDLLSRWHTSQDWRDFFSGLPSEYQSAFRQKLMQHVLEQAVATHSLTEWLVSHLNDIEDGGYLDYVSQLKSLLRERYIVSG